MTLPTPTLPPWPFQQEVIDDTLDASFDGRLRGVIELPTGAGKTLVATWLFYHTLRRGGHGLFLTPQKELCRQGYETMVAHFGAWNVGRVEAEYNQLGRRVTVATDDTLRDPERLAMLLRSVGGGFEVIGADEAHLSVSPTQKTILGAARRPWGLLFGPTATPYRSDEQNLRQVYPDGVFASVDYLSLVTSGHLCDVISYLIPTTTDPASAGDDEEEARRLAASNRYNETWTAWKKLAGSCPTFGYARSVPDAYAFAKYFREHGMPAEVIHGGTPDNERADLLAACRAGALVLWNFGVLSTGIDMKELGCVIIARNMAMNTFLQCVGRGMRAAQDKETMLLLNVSEKHYPICTMGDLFGRHMEAQPSLRAALREQLEEDVASLPREVREALPEDIWSRMKAVQAHQIDVFAGTGWLPVRGSSADLSKSSEYGLYIAENHIGGYIVSFLHASGARSILNHSPLPMRYAQALATQDLTRRAERAKMADGTSEHLHEPASRGEVERLRNQRIGGIPRGKSEQAKAAFAAFVESGIFTHAHYQEAARWLAEHGGRNWSPEGLCFDTDRRVLYERRFKS